MPAGGLVAISVTPLDAAGDIDLASIDRLMEFYLRAGADGVALLGVMGEANRMTDADARHVVERAVATIDGRVPVIVVGLAVFAAGSILAAYSDTVWGVIAGRLLQGAGAISATLTALIADATRDGVRTRSMAVFGVGVGGASTTGTPCCWQWRRRAYQDYRRHTWENANQWGAVVQL